MFFSCCTHPTTLLKSFGIPIYPLRGGECAQECTGEWDCAGECALECGEQTDELGVFGEFLELAGILLHEVGATLHQ